MPMKSTLVTAQQPSLAVLLTSSFAFIIVQLDVTIFNVALPRMGLELGARATHYGRCAELVMRWLLPDGGVGSGL